MSLSRKAENEKYKVSIRGKACTTMLPPESVASPVSVVNCKLLIGCWLLVVCVNMDSYSRQR